MNMTLKEITVSVLGPLSSENVISSLFFPLGSTSGGLGHEHESEERRDPVDSCTNECIRSSSMKLSLVLLFGSWNSFLPSVLSCTDVSSSCYPILRPILQSSVKRNLERKEVEESELILQVAALQVDQNEYCLDMCTSDYKCRIEDDIMGHPFKLYAPEDLPAFILVSSYNPNSSLLSNESNKYLQPYYTIEHVPIDSRTLYSLCTKSSSSSSLSHIGIQQDNMKSFIEQAMDNAIQKCFQYHPMKSKSVTNYTPPLVTNKNNPLDTRRSHHAKDTKEKVERENDNDEDEPLRIFIAGDRSQVGKSSICLGILGSLLQDPSFDCQPSEIAYIKPATQCEASTLVAQFCAQQGIDAIPIGPIVYYRGFTRSFLQGDIQETRESLLDQVSRVVDRLSIGQQPPTTSVHRLVVEEAETSTKRKKKKIIIIDGVGYPAVGSVCGTDNADIAWACGYPVVNRHKKRRTEHNEVHCTKSHFSLKEDDSSNESNDLHTSVQYERQPPAVLIVGRSGVGDAIDSYNFNSSYFLSKGVPVMGAIFNRFSTDETNYYNLHRCKEAIESYFRQYKAAQTGETVFGYLPESQQLNSISNTTSSTSTADPERALQAHIHEWIQLFSSHVDVHGILQAARLLRDKKSESSYLDSFRQGKKQVSPETSNFVTIDSVNNHPMTHCASRLSFSHVDQLNIRSKHTFLTREQIEKAAKREGAASG